MAYKEIQFLLYICDKILIKVIIYPHPVCLFLMDGIMPVSKYHDSSDSIGLIFLMKFDLNDLTIQENNVETRKRSWGFDSVESLVPGCKSVSV